MLDLVGNHKDRFSHNEAHIYVLTYNDQRHLLAANLKLLDLSRSAFTEMFKSSKLKVNIFGGKLELSPN